MGQYKVPQNVEAEDKIIGPLTLKQFIYAIIGIAWAGLCFLIFSKISIVVVIVTAFPFTLLFMLLAFYQRDGQNFEQFLVAVVGFFSQSRQRVWRKEEIIDSFKVEPKKVVDEHTQRNPDEVRSQLERLATIVDARGWAENSGSEQASLPSDQRRYDDESDRLVRPVITSPNTTIGEPEVNDVLDLQSSPLAQNLSTLLTQASTDMRSEAIEAMRQKVSAPKKAPVPQVAPVQPVTPVAAVTAPAPTVAATPAPIAAVQVAAATPVMAGASPAQAIPLTPSEMPLIPGEKPQPATPSISVTKQIPGGILKLATESDDLTVSQIAAQATRVGALPEGQAVSLSNGAKTSNPVPAK